MISPGCGLENADRIASVVMEVVFDHLPAHLSVEEVMRCLGVDTALCDPIDVRDAIGDLARAGLLHRSGDFVFATRAAVRAAELGL